MFQAKRILKTIAIYIEPIKENDIYFTKARNNLILKRNNFGIMDFGFWPRVTGMSKIKQYDSNISIYVQYSKEFFNVKLLYAQDLSVFVYGSL